MSCDPPARRHSSHKRNNLRVKTHDLDNTHPAEHHGSPISGRSAASIICNANEALAANLSAAFPRTPQRATPNSAKRRRQIPDLSRSTPTSSHGTHISKIFRDAAATLQDLRTSQSKPSSNMKKSRLPISQARAGKFGSASQDNTVCSEALGTSSPTYGDRGLLFGTNSELQKPRSVRALTATRSGDSTAQEFPEHRHTHLPVLPNPSSSTPIASTTDVHHQSHGEDKGKEPISSGYATPSALYSQPPETPEDICYPNFNNGQLPWSSSILGSDGGDYLPSRGVPLAIPLSSPTIVEHDGAKVEDWLNDIHTLINADDSDPRIVKQQPTGMGHLAVGTAPGTPAAMTYNPRKKGAHFATPKPKQGQCEPFYASSDKENVSPPKSMPSPTRLPVQHLANTPSRFHNHKFDTAAQSAGAVHFTHPLTPQGHLNGSPRRKKARASLDGKPNPPKSGKDFTIHDEQVANALAQLSPDVELRRKGRRPKRERCMSYWDEDILQRDSPCLPMDFEEDAAPVSKGRKVLGVSHETAQLTKEKPFVKEARNAAFDFQTCGKDYDSLT